MLALAERQLSLPPNLLQWTSSSIKGNISSPLWPVLIHLLFPKETVVTVRFEVKVTELKLDLGSFGLLYLLLELLLLKEALPLPVSSSRLSTEQCRAFCHTQHPSMRSQHGIRAEGVGFGTLRPQIQTPFSNAELLLKSCYFNIIFQ